MNDKPQTLEALFITKYIALEKDFIEYKNKNKKLEDTLKNCRLIIDNLRFTDDGINLLIDGVFRAEEREGIIRVLKYLNIDID